MKAAENECVPCVPRFYIIDVQRARNVHNADSQHTRHTWKALGLIRAEQRHSGRVVRQMRNAIAVLAVLLMWTFAFVAVYPSQALDAAGWIAATLAGAPIPNG